MSSAWWGGQVSKLTQIALQTLETNFSGAKKHKPEVHAHSPTHSLWHTLHQHPRRMKDPSPHPPRPDGCNCWIVGVYGALGLCRRDLCGFKRSETVLISPQRHRQLHYHQSRGQTRKIRGARRGCMGGSADVIRRLHDSPDNSMGLRFHQRLSDCWGDTPSPSLM